MKILPPNVNVVIEGRNIRLQPISRREIGDRYLYWLNDDNVNRFLEMRYKKQTFPDIYQYINGIRSKMGCEVFGIFSKNEHVHVGNFAINQFNENDQGLASYGILIGDEYAQQLGYGAETTCIMLEFIFRQSQIRKIFARVISENHGSWMLLEDMGFVREGTLRQFSMLRSGQICDCYEYGLLRKEWIGQRKKFAFILDHMNVFEATRRMEENTVVDTHPR